MSLVSLNILIADDNPSDRLLLKAMLSGLGHNVEVAEDGLEAIEKFDPDSTQLVCLDVVMPECDGLEAAIKIQEMSRGRFIPIVFLGLQGSRINSKTFLFAFVFLVCLIPLTMGIGVLITLAVFFTVILTRSNFLLTILLIFGGLFLSLGTGEYLFHLHGNQYPYFVYGIGLFDNSFIENDWLTWQTLNQHFVLVIFYTLFNILAH